MKRGVFLLGIFALLLSITLVSAQQLSLSQILSSIEPSMMILGVIWVVSFAIVYFAMSKSIFKEQNVIAAVIAFAVSLLITYGYNQSGWNFQAALPSIGISLDFLYVLVPILVIGLLIFMFIKLKSGALFIVGGIMLLAAILNLVYEKTLLVIVGVILVAAGIPLAMRQYKKSHQKSVLEHLMRPRR